MSRRRRARRTLQALDADLMAGEEEIGRRKLLVRLLAGAAGALGLAALFPIRSLGPRPGAGSEGQPLHRAATHLVTGQGERVRPDDVAVDGFITVFPEGNPHDANGPDAADPHPAGAEPALDPGREDWAVDDLVAYSKICTHAGCPVGLYQAAERPAAVPVPPVDLRRGRRGPSGLRAGHPLAAAAAARRSTTTATSSPAVSSPAPIGPGFWDQLR